MTLLTNLLTRAALTAALSLPFAAVAQTSATPKTTTATTNKAPSKNAPPTAADIADAKSKGLVWLNTNSDTKAYHKSDDKYYGKTKSGKFMTEADAQKAGYHLSKEPTPKQKTATTPSK